MSKDWQQSPVLVGEDDYWDPDQAKRRRELTGVAQGLLDLQAVAVHQHRDPDQALADWEQHARAAGSDDMETFNEFARWWRVVDLGGLGHPFAGPPAVPGLYLIQGTVSWDPNVPAQNFHQYVQYGKEVGRYPTRPARRTVREVREQFDQFAAEHQMDPEGLWQEFNEFYVTVPYDLETAAESFLGSKRLALIPVEITMRVLDSFSESLEKIQTALYGLGQTASPAAEATTLTMENWKALMPRLAPLEAPSARPDVCYRCGRDHGSRPCRPTRR